MNQADSSVSVFGFLASEEPFVGGNYGFKDCWLGLQWVQENISAFGGEFNEKEKLFQASEASYRPRIRHELHVDAQATPTASTSRASAAVGTSSTSSCTTLRGVRPCPRPSSLRYCSRTRSSRRH